MYSLVAKLEATNPDVVAAVVGQSDWTTRIKGDDLSYFDSIKATSVDIVWGTLTSKDFNGAQGHFFTPKVRVTSTNSCSSSSVKI